jgi:hypothetical protein
MKSTDNVGITFANTVINQGILNGVINVNLGVFHFSPSEDGKEIVADPAVICRLRMDEVCAIQLHNALRGILAAIEKSRAASVASGVAANDETRGTHEALN